MYSICGYGRMIADSVRIKAYTQALQQALRPGAVVVDIGTGTGFFALLACQLGARRVYAIEPADAIQVAREIALANRCADGIEFIQGFSTRVSLPERADVIISDLRDVLPLFGQHIPSIVDARARLLAEGGTLIPQRDRVWVAIVEAPELYDWQVGPWRDVRYGFGMAAGHQIATSTWRKARVRPEQLLVEPRCWATLDYRVIEEADVSGELRWRAERAGTAHGLIAWFDTELAEGLGFSNAPMAPELLYGSAFFPLAAPVSISAGDTVSLDLQARLIGGSYVWNWKTCFLDQGCSGSTKARFDQSTFFATPLSPERLRRRAAGHRPILTEDGQIDRLALALMDCGEHSLMEIARHVRESFPARFSHWQEALARVGDLSERYGR